jgi:hypothetical protein
VRVTAGAAVLDPEGVRLNEGSPLGSRSVLPAALAFDGTSYLAVLLVPDPEVGEGSQMFIARLDPNGTVRDQELEGLLVHAGGTAGLPFSVFDDPAAIAVTRRIAASTTRRTPTALSSTPSSRNASCCRPLEVRGERTPGPLTWT